MFQVFAACNQIAYEEVREATRLMRGWMRAAYLKRYFELRPAGREQLKRWLAVTFAARLAEVVLPGGHILVGNDVDTEQAVCLVSRAQEVHLAQAAALALQPQFRVAAHLFVAVRVDQHRREHLEPRGAPEVEHARRAAQGSAGLRLGGDVK